MNHKQMDRELLISYSLYYQGEYKQIRKAITERKTVPFSCCENAVTIFDENYPREFFDLRYPPYVLYYKGDLQLLKRKKIAIVGSRNCCDYAKEATERLAKRYSDRVIISGLAKGIDAIAHQNAHMTIGILGCGIDRVYPYENRGLIRKISDRGLILSEYPGNAPPLNYHFPFRNRLIAALADTVYIMQAVERSGTMTTVNEALELGREVRVLPYSLFEECGIGNNRLIYEGATPIERTEIAI